MPSFARLLMRRLASKSMTKVVPLGKQAYRQSLLRGWLDFSSSHTASPIGHRIPRSQIRVNSLFRLGVGMRIIHQCGFICYMLSIT